MTVGLALTDLIGAAFARRVAPLADLRGQADALALACHAMATRFHRGGRLLVFGNGTGTTDAQHVAVEFVHPVTVGKRSLPAVSLAGDVATLLGVAAQRGFDGIYAHQVKVLGRPEDIALGLSDDTSVRAGLAAARSGGLLTVALTGGPGDDIAVDHRLRAACDDPPLVKEVHVTAYHLLWELVHVFLDSPPTPAPAAGVERLYPFLYGGGSAPSQTLAATAESVRQKIDEIVQLRSAVGADQCNALADCATAIATRVQQGATVFALGNGGSSTDSQDVVQQLMSPPAGRRPIAALGLTNDVAVVTALSNDVGFDVVFARQVRAFGRAGDIVVALSTSGGSQNVLDALEQAHAMGLLTIGLAGYGGGRMAQSPAVDHLFAVPSSSVHRVQEVQTTLTHVLWEAVSAVLSGAQKPPPPDRG